ncbi:unnamed protein product [Amoebophrya sp. A25]|nr:unnamed protein product [Amoebophrya sp. A25]|eukprot:GSA25T00015531001.1
MKLQIQDGKRRLEMEVSGRETIKDVKAFVASSDGPPIEFQKLLAKGKERLDDVILADIPLQDGAKVMIMRRAGAPERTKVLKEGDGEAAAQEKTDDTKADTTDVAPVETKTVMFLPEDKSGSSMNHDGDHRDPTTNSNQTTTTTSNGNGAGAQEATSESGQEATIRVKQGRDSHTITLGGSKVVAGVTWADLAAHLHAYCIPQVAAKHYRFLAKGKEISDLSTRVFPPDQTTSSSETSRTSSKALSCSVMLLFREGHYVEKDNAQWVRERAVEVEALADRMGTLEKRVSHRMADEDTFLEIWRAESLVAAVQSAADAVGVKGEDIEKKRKLQEMVKDLSMRLQQLRKKM